MEMDCVGMKEGGASGQEESKQQANNLGLTQKLQIPPGWLEVNNLEIEFTYVHGAQADKDIKMKIVQKDGNKIDV